MFRLEKNEFDQLFPKVRLEEFKKLPLPENINSESAKKIDSVVREIVNEKKSMRKTDMSRKKMELDRLVYELYDLTEEEVKIIEKT